MLFDVLLGIGVALLVVVLLEFMLGGMNVGALLGGAFAVGLLMVMDPSNLYFAASYGVTLLLLFTLTRVRKSRGSPEE